MDSLENITIERTLYAAVRNHLVGEVEYAHKRINRLEAELRALRLVRSAPPAGRTRPRKGGPDV